MATIIRGGGGGKKTKNTKLADTQAEDVLVNSDFVNYDGNIQQGSMPNHGAVTQALDGGNSYTIPLGYHNGNGVISANIPDCRYVTYAIYGKSSYGWHCSGVLDTSDRKLPCYYSVFGGIQAGSCGIQGSNDNANWTTIRSGSNGDARNGGTQGVATGYRYYRVYSNANTSDNAAGWMGYLCCVNLW